MSVHSVVISIILTWPNFTYYVKGGKLENGDFALNMENMMVLVMKRNVEEVIC